MTLLATVLAAIITSIIWYKKDNRKEYCLNVLLYMFWGASIMWLVDAIVELIQEGAAYFMPEEGTTIEETLMNQMHFFYSQMNDLFLGLAVIALALIIWLVIVIIKDPKHLYRKKDE